MTDNLDFEIAGFYSAHTNINFVLVAEKLKQLCQTVDKQSEVIAAHERYFESLHDLVLNIQKDIEILLTTMTTLKE